MIILNGKYAEARVYTDIIDEASATQIISLLNQPMCSGTSVRIMPDVHAGFKALLLTSRGNSKNCFRSVGD